MEIQKRILALHAQSDKRLGVKQMKLPKMSTVKLPGAVAYKEYGGVCQNLLTPKFNPKLPNLVFYISGFYNARRHHSHNCGLSPNQAENVFFHNLACPLY